jgi:sulfane dehydrogenase subunit SoxC
MTSVKWLTSIEAVREPFDGYQQATAYHYRRDADDPGEPVTRIRVRALMVPPGIPDFMTRRRFVERGTVELFGRAWSGQAPGQSDGVEAAAGDAQAAALARSPSSAARPSTTWIAP